MQPAALDPFHPLLRVIDRYRRDVHHLQPPSSTETIKEAAGYLGQPIPLSLATFLHRWNGADLFRGALRIRAVAQLGPAAESAPAVIVFADGPAEADHWAYAPDGQGEAVFGRWREGAFEPMHEHFDRWLMAMVRILDENLREDGAQLDARLDADPDCGYLLLARAERVLAEGDPEKAQKLLRRATAAQPGLVAAWERLADTLLGEDKLAARFAYMKAMRAVRLPAAYPTAWSARPALIHTLGRLFPAGDDGWERELDHLLAEGVADVATWAELDLAEAAAVSLARTRLARSERASAREALANFLERVPGFQVRGPCAEATLLLIDIETDLGQHDEAEKRLRAFRHAPPPLQARAALSLARIAVARQEPWAEEILREASGLTEPGLRAQAMLLAGERHLLLERRDEARECFAQVDKIASQLQDKSLGALAKLGEGDVLRACNDLAGAETCYREARAQAGDNPELLNRVLVRRGDMFRVTGDRDRAIADFTRAAEGYRRMELPLREAWARLRLARLGVDEALDRAEELFRAADLAAGIAAVDSARQDPARSLQWHLDRSTEHARDRANAARVRPPLVRADADRPERRIGAHRMAISACGPDVVATISAELETLARALDLSNPRPSDPQLARYIAAADLLAAHRSYEASEAMLHQLLTVRPAGLPGRALVAALARSNNAALVHDLLLSVERGGEAGAVALAIEILGWRREEAAVDVLRRTVSASRNRGVRRAAIVALGRIGDCAATTELLPVLDEAELAEETAVALLLLGEWQGVDYQAQALASERPGLTRSPGEIVGRYGGPSYLLLLMRTAELDGPAGMGALQGLGYLGDPRAVPRLIDACGVRDPNRAQVACGALEILTGHHEALDEALVRARWGDWWASNGSKFTSGLRYRNGRLFDAGQLIERLAHDDAFVRRNTYDELVISTGVRMPFDPEGPYRVQVAHQTAWRRWWRENCESLRPGRWSFHGEEIG